MSEQLIPLRIADQAVAACNAEIIKLQEENARLKAEVNRLTDFCTLTIIPNEQLQEQIEQLQNRCDYLEGKTDEA